jgi:hypothetical protein
MSENMQQNEDGSWSPAEPVPFYPHDGYGVLKMFLGMVILAFLVLAAVTLLTMYAWFVALLMAASGSWVIVPAVGIPAVCAWAAYKVAQW